MSRHKTFNLLCLSLLEITVVQIALIFKIHHVCVVLMLSFFLLDVNWLFVIYLGIAWRTVKLAMNLEFGDDIIPVKLLAFRVEANTKMNFGIVVWSFNLDLKHWSVWMQYFFLRKMVAAQRENCCVYDVVFNLVRCWFFEADKCFVSKHKQPMHPSFIRGRVFARLNDFFIFITLNLKTSPQVTRFPDR